VHGGGTILGAGKRAARDLDLLKGNAAHLVRQRGLQLETIRHTEKWAGYAPRVLIPCCD
jgi:hypothetical protein